MDSRKILLLVFGFSLSHFIISGQFLNKHELEVLDSCQFCSEWTKEEGFAFDTLRVLRYYDNNRMLRRVEGFNDQGDITSVSTYDENGRMGPLSYELYSNGNVRDYAINNSCVESIYTFNANGQIQEIWFQPKFDDLLFIYNYSDEGILRLKREFDRWNVEVQYLWVYDSKGQIREEGFENKGVPFGIWKYYNRKGKLKRTVDFGPKK